MSKWVTYYRCSCGAHYTNGLGTWDNKFFLRPEVCDNCGKDKYTWERIGQCKEEWKPKLFNWARVKVSHIDGLSTILIFKKDNWIEENQIKEKENEKA